MNSANSAMSANEVFCQTGKSTPPSLPPPFRVADRQYAGFWQPKKEAL
jgi:hypothetical protein